MPIAGTVVASPGKRALACVLDLVAVVLLGGGFLAAGLWQQLGAGRPAPLLVVGGGLVLVGLVAVQWWLLGARGVTLGKQLVGLRVVDAGTGRVVGPARALVRVALQVAAAVVPVLGHVLLLASPLLDPSGRRQGWHDRLSGAVVLDVGLGLDPVHLPEQHDVARRLDDLLARPSGAGPGVATVDRFGRWPDTLADDGVTSAVGHPVRDADLRGAAPTEPARTHRPRSTPFLPDSTTQPTGEQPVVPPPHVERPTVVVRDDAPVVTASAAGPAVGTPASRPGTPAVGDVIATVPFEPPTARHVRRDEPATAPVAPPPGPPAPGPAPLAPTPESRRARREAAPPAVPVAPVAPAAPPAPPAAPVAAANHRTPPSSPETDAARERPVPPSAAPVERAVAPDQPDLADDVERTRLRPARVKVPELETSSPEVTLELTDGRRVVLTGTALLGRDPEARAGEHADQLIGVADPGRSVSKTHLAVGVDRSGVWVRDRGSTNGTVVTLADGQQILCGPDQQVRVPVGASVAFGDYGFTVAEG